MGNHAKLAELSKKMKYSPPDDALLEELSEK